VVSLYESLKMFVLVVRPGVDYCPQVAVGQLANQVLALLLPS
jgi:hypothetical protein